MENSFLTGFDKPKWRACSPAITSQVAWGSLSFDERNKDTFPYIYHLASATVLNCYSKVTDERQSVISPALTWVFGAWAFSVMRPSAWPTWTITSGSTNTKITLSTVLPASVWVNQLANRGDWIGFRIRIIDNSSWASWKIAERRIVANTGWTAPAIIVDEEFGFIPATGSTYEFVSPRIYMLSSGLLAAWSFKYYDCLTNSLSWNLSITGLPATLTTDTTGFVTDERYVPYNKRGGSWYLVDELITYDSTSLAYKKNCLQATAIWTNSITWMVSSWDFSVLTDEYKNFCQIRIVEDTVNPTAVWQRRRITTHTAWPSAVYTLASNWTVTPSANCKFVIENNNDVMHLFTTGSTSCYTYNFTANVRDTTTIWVRGGAIWAGVRAEHASSIVPDAEKNARHSHVFTARGWNVNTIDLLNLATRTWENNITYGNKWLTTFTTGSCSAKDPATNLWRYIYIALNWTTRNQRFNMMTRTLEPNTILRQVASTSVAGQRLAYTSKSCADWNKISSIIQILTTSYTVYQLDLLFELVSEQE
jgi:hypothetical protein